MTLEDILHQDPREKVDDFPNLGYYFISFRTIESQKTKETAQREPDPFATTQDFDEGYIAETNVYLAVFIDGICCVRAPLDQVMIEISLSFQSFIIPTLRVRLNPIYV